jgi:choline dehydrogenase-like flavoprotein
VTGRASYDYVVAGGGTAGAVVAARLSEDPSVSVALLEWGPDDRHEPRALQIRRWSQMLESEYDLDYASVPQPRGNSGIRQARACILGGCSAHNTMIALRPPRADFDRWVALGADGWDAGTMNGYFGRLAVNIVPVATGRWAYRSARTGTAPTTGTAPASCPSGTTRTPECAPHPRWPTCTPSWARGTTSTC